MAWARARAAGGAAPVRSMVNGPRCPVSLYSYSLPEQIVTIVKVAARRLGARMMSTPTAAFAIMTAVEAAHPPPP